MVSLGTPAESAEGRACALRDPLDVIADLARLLGRLAARQDVEAEEAEHARRHLRQIQQRPTEPGIDR